MAEYLDRDGLEYFYGKLAAKFNDKQSQIDAHSTSIDQLSAGKVDKAAGKALSDRNFTEFDELLVNALEVSVGALFPNASSIDLNSSAFLLQRNDVNVKRFTLDSAKPLTNAPISPVSAPFQMICERIPSLESGGVLTRQTFIYSRDGSPSLTKAFTRQCLVRMLSNTIAFSDWSAANEFTDAYKSKLGSIELDGNVIGNDISGNAASSSKLTTSSKGSASKPVYFSGGVPKECGSSLNVGISGNAATASKLTTSSKGSASKPVYFSDGVPQECGSSLDVNIYGNAATAECPMGFYGSDHGAVSWGVQTGIPVTTWITPYLGSVSFRDNCPNENQLSMVIDGRFYQNEGRYRCIDESDMMSPFVSWIDLMPNSTGTFDVSGINLLLLNISYRSAFRANTNQQLLPMNFIRENRSSSEPWPVPGMNLEVYCGGTDDSTLYLRNLNNENLILLIFKIM